MGKARRGGRGEDSAECGRGPKVGGGGERPRRAEQGDVRGVPSRNRPSRRLPLRRNPESCFHPKVVPKPNRCRRERCKPKESQGEKRGNRREWQRERQRQKALHHGSCRQFLMDTSICRAVCAFLTPWTSVYKKATKKVQKS